MACHRICLKRLLAKIYIWLLGNQAASHNVPVFEQTSLVGEIQLWCEEETSHFVMV
jgi:hypothetical protein